MPSPGAVCEIALDQNVIDRAFGPHATLSVCPLETHHHVIRNKKEAAKTQSARQHRADVEANQKKRDARERGGGVGERGESGDPRNREARGGTRKKMQKRGGDEYYRVHSVT